jgi:hypothetical protein
VVKEIERGPHGQRDSETTNVIERRRGKVIERRRHGCGGRELGREENTSSLRPHTLLALRPHTLEA